MIPMFLVVMVAVGCFMPSIDSTAGERERSTWETLMTAAVSRTSIVVAKYLYVATLGVTAGVLNVVAVALSLGPALKPLLGDAGSATEFHIRPLALAMMFVGAALLALFFAAAMMILASFARTFKDGQSMITPIYWLALIPILLGATPDQTLTPLLALIPIANVAMMIRDAIGGVFHWWLIGLTILVEIIVVASCLRLARAILGFEDLLLGSYSGSFWRFTRDRLLRRRPRAAEAGS
jgi:sodium transport system permease protein